MISILFKIAQRKLPEPRKIMCMYADEHTGSLEMMSSNILLLEGGTEQKTQRQEDAPEVKTHHMQQPRRCVESM